jgi:hypothetical protein
MLSFGPHSMARNEVVQAIRTHSSPYRADAGKIAD